MAEKESKLEITGVIRTKEKSPEEIQKENLDILRQAIESGSRVYLEVSNPPHMITAAIVFPDEIKDNHLWLTTDKSYGITIELSRIRKVMIVE